MNYLNKAFVRVEFRQYITCVKEIYIYNKYISGKTA